MGTEKKDVKRGKWGTDQLNFVPVDPKKIKFANRPKSPASKKAPAKKR